VVNAEDYFIGPAIDITRMTILHAGPILTRYCDPGPIGRVTVRIESAARVGLSSE